MDIVEFLMARRKWRNMCLRCNIVPKEKIEIYKKTRLAIVESNALGKSEHLQLTAPEWWRDETMSEKHRDHSYVLFLGVRFLEYDLMHDYLH